MKGLTSRIIWGLVFAVLVMVGLGIYADVQALVVSFSLFDWSYLFPALALAMGNYLVRFIRWHLYLKEIDVAHRVPVFESFAIFTGGLVMSITPGKVGELLKSVMLKERRGIPVPTSAPVVVAERLTDFVAVLLLCLGGAMSAQYGVEVVSIAGGLSLLAIVVLSSEKTTIALLNIGAKLPLVGGIVPTLREAYRSMRILVRPMLLVKGVGLGTLAWWLECVALYVVLLGFSDLTPQLGHCVFIYAFATLAGAVTMLPGGLVFTEGSMIALLTVVVPFMVTEEPAIATAATVVVRFCTLWFAIGLGIMAMGWLRLNVPPSSSEIME